MMFTILVYNYTGAEKVEFCALSVLLVLELCMHIQHVDK